MDKWHEFSCMIDTGEIKMDQERRDFCCILDNRFNLKVSYFSYYIWPGHASLEFYVSNCENDFLDIIINSKGCFNRIDHNKLSLTFFPKTYKYQLKLHENDIPFVKDDMVPPFAVNLAHKTIDEYYAFTKKPQNVLTLVSFYSFEKSILEQVYFQSLQSIREALGRKSGMRFYITSKKMYGTTLSVVLPHEKMVLLNENSVLLNKLKKECYLITKKYDKFGFLNEDDYAIEFYDESTARPEHIGLDPRDLNY